MDEDVKYLHKLIAVLPKEINDDKRRNLVIAIANLIEVLPDNTPDFNDDCWEDALTYREMAGIE